MLKKLNQVMDYIDEHLTDELPLAVLAEYAGVSDYHFRKIFFYLSGMTLHEYVRRRRLSEANQALLRGESVTTVAFRYGYESIDGFTRAFKKWSGVLPSEVMKEQINRLFPKATFIISMKGGTLMEVRMEEKPAFYLAGVTGRVPMQFEGVNDEIVKLAMRITTEQREALHTLQDIAPFEIVNASYDADTHFMKEEGTLSHLIGVLTTQGEASNLLEKIPVPACTWAVFPNEGAFPSTLQSTMAMAYSEWLPSSGYELLPAPMFSFTKMDEARKDYAYSEVWIPLRKQ